MIQPEAEPRLFQRLVGGRRPGFPQGLDLLPLVPGGIFGGPPASGIVGVGPLKKERGAAVDAVMSPFTHHDMHMRLFPAIEGTTDV